VRNARRYSREAIAMEVMRPYAGHTIPGRQLEEIIAATIAFDFPLVPLDDRIAALELFHGPTLAFKDVGARFMSRCLGYFSHDLAREITVLVATSGDTGGAVANAFDGVPGVSVVILYPSGKVSLVQELQLTTLGSHITALEIEGNFDDCQRLVKQAFGDEELSRRLFLTSANSINIARWLPQQLYYFFAWQQWQDQDQPPVISVPSGNFGNLCAGLLAWRSGLPVQHFIAACNANDTVPEFLATGSYPSKDAIATMSNAMDVADPSNFVRLLELFHHDTAALKSMVSAYSISDDETREAIRALEASAGYLADPHGAVGYEALRRHLDMHPAHKGIFLETAHPVKFCDVAACGNGDGLSLPGMVQALLKKEKHAVKMPPEFEALKRWMLR